MADRRTYTVAEVAQRWRCEGETVLSHIHAGRLQAFSLGAPNARRPTWRISADSVERFERGDITTPPPKPKRRRKQKVAPGFIEYY